MSASDGEISVNKCTNDIMDTLQEDLVHRILDRVSVRDAARTTILSRKWRFVWPQHPHLVLDENFYFNFMMKKDGGVRDYERAITNILFLHNGPILKFILYVPNLGLSWDNVFPRWLSYISRNGVKEISLLSNEENTHKLPSYVFRCPELEYLQLRNFIVKPPNEFTGLGKLVSLHLIKVALSDAFLEILVPGAPLLEVLSFTRCTGIHYLRIMSSKLKTFLCIECSDIQTVSFESIPTLNHLSITLGEKARNMATKVDLIELLNKFPALEKLQFDCFLLKLSSVGTSPSTLADGVNHIRTLVLSAFEFDDFDQMSCLLCLLRNCIELETLHIRVYQYKRRIFVERFSLPVSDVDDSASCSNLNDLFATSCSNQNLNNLRKVTISSMSGLRSEMLFIKMMLASAPMLETVFVSYSVAEKALEISTEMMSYCRASPKASIVCEKSPSLLCSELFFRGGLF